MVDSEEGDMDKLELSSDSTDIIITKKRPRMEDSEDEANNSSTKKQRNSSNDEQSEILKKDNAEAVSGKNGTNEYDVKEEKHTIYSESEQNVHEKFLSEPNMDKEDKEKQDNKPIKQENGNENLLDKDELFAS
ncbi:hira-interacting protein 3, partial [Lasius niger]